MLLTPLCLIMAMVESPKEEDRGRQSIHLMLEPQESLRTTEWGPIKQQALQLRHLCSLSSLHNNINPTNSLRSTFSLRTSLKVIVLPRQACRRRYRHRLHHLQVPAVLVSKTFSMIDIFLSKDVANMYH